MLALARSGPLVDINPTNNLFSGTHNLTYSTTDSRLYTQKRMSNEMDSLSHGSHPIERLLFPAANAATGLGLLQWLPLHNLYRPVLVTVAVDDPARDFRVPWALICEQSNYFAKAFSEHFKEGKQNVLRLADVRAEVFEVLVGWLYSGRIYHESAADC